MPDPVRMSGDLSTHYGPYAFGVAAMVVIVILMVWAAWWLWTKIVQPDLRARQVISEKNAEAQASLRESVSGLERLNATMSESVRLADVHRQHLERMVREQGPGCRRSD